MTIRMHGRGVAAVFGLIGGIAAGIWLGRGPQSAALAAPPQASPAPRAPRCRRPIGTSGSSPISTDRSRSPARTWANI